jgi:NAD(P)-dependent dehydrogenase (short-subunit alcohol dehydrogenase family)
MSGDSFYSLEQKVVLVTGGAGLLGFAVCRGLAKAGASVAVGSRSKERADAVVEALGQLQSTAQAAVFDVNDEKAVQRAVKTIVRKSGRVDGLVLCHNQPVQGSHDSISVAQWRAGVDSAITGAFLVTREVARAMAETTGGGSIVLISSVLGLRGADPRIHGSRKCEPQNGAYWAGKAGMYGLGRFLAAHYAPLGIRVNIVSPGGLSGEDDEHHRHTRTEDFEIPQPLRESFEARVPMQRLGEPQEIVGAIHYLLSDSASYTTGAELIVDGGYSCV